MASSGRPVTPTPIDLYPPAKHVPQTPPSSAQRRAEAQCAHDAANPPARGAHTGGGDFGWTPSK
jgi:hypothetical protein